MEKQENTPATERQGCSYFMMRGCLAIPSLYILGVVVNSIPNISSIFSLVFDIVLWVCFVFLFLKLEELLLKPWGKPPYLIGSFWKELCVITIDVVVGAMVANFISREVFVGEEYILLNVLIFVFCVCVGNVFPRFSLGRFLFGLFKKSK